MFSLSYLPLLGYGFDINWQRSLPLVTSILDFFTNHDDSSQPHIALRYLVIVLPLALVPI